jgi:excisionase family DNA binding protein
MKRKGVMPMEERLLLRGDEVAKLLGIGRSTAFDLMAGGVLPVVRIGRSVRVPRNRLLEWIEERTTVEADGGLVR